MASCRVCGRQVEVSDSGQPMPCVCILHPLDAFLADCALSLGKVKAGKYKPKPRTVYELTDPAFHPGA